MPNPPLNIAPAAPGSITPHTLRDYVRTQHTSRVCHVEMHTIKETGADFTDEWHDDNKQRVATHLGELSINTNAIVITATSPDRQIHALAAVLPGRFGPDDRYQNLAYFHVSKPHRHQGLGKQLFSTIANQARQRNIPRLYIAAHPSVDTVRFYLALGCTLSTYIHPPIYERESRDLQLEYTLNST